MYTEPRRAWFVSKRGNVATACPMSLDRRTPPDEGPSLLAEAARLEARGEPATLCTVVQVTGSAPRGLGARMIVYSDGRIRGTIGGGSLERQVVERCRSSPITEPILIQSDLGHDAGMACGGRVQVLLEPLGRTPWLLLFGAGHIASALAPMAADCGFRVAVVDRQTGSWDPARFPEGTLWFPTLEEATGAAVPLDERSYAVIATGDHARDGEVLASVLAYPLSYVGMIGSQAKVMSLLADLCRQGVSGEALARVRAPIGLDIGAETPAEIAVSILAEIVAVRRAKHVRRLGRPLAEITARGRPPQPGEPGNPQSAQRA